MALGGINPKQKLALADGGVGIVKIHRESVASLAYLRQRLHERFAGQEARGLELLIDPAEEAIGHRFGLRHAHFALDF
jgi:hypothetical protein